MQDQRLTPQAGTVTSVAPLVVQVSSMPGWPWDALVAAHGTGLKVGSRVLAMANLDTGLVVVTGILP